MSGKRSRMDMGALKPLKMVVSSIGLARELMDREQEIHSSDIVQ